MIIVEIDVPAIGKKYDFQIDETVPIYELREEVAELICRKEQCPLYGDVQRLLIWTRGGRKLDQEKTAYENGLRTGEQILLI